MYQQVLLHFGQKSMPAVEVQGLGVAFDHRFGGPQLGQQKNALILVLNGCYLCANQRLFGIEKAELLFRLAPPLFCGLAVEYLGHFQKAFYKIALLLGQSFDCHSASSRRTSNGAQKKVVCLNEVRRVP